MSEERKLWETTIRRKLGRCKECGTRPKQCDPLFLQIKEARASVLEPYAGQSVFPPSRSARCRWLPYHAAGK